MLKTLFASKGFNAKELDGLADLVIAQNTLTDDSTDQDLQTAADAAKPTADFVQSVASRQVTDVKKPKPVETIVTTTEQNTDVDPNETPSDKALRLIMEKLEKQELAIAAFGQEKVTNTRKEALLKTLEGLPETFRELKLESFEGKSFKDDDEFNSFIEKTKTQSAGFVQEESNAGLGNDKPAGGKGGNAGAVKLASDTELDAVMENL